MHLFDLLFCALQLYCTITVADHCYTAYPGNMHLFDLHFCALQLYCTKEGAICDPAFLIKRLAQLPLGAEFCDGGQHDSQEVLRLLLDSLHNDLVRPALHCASAWFVAILSFRQISTLYMMSWRPVSST